MPIVSALLFQMQAFPIQFCGTVEIARKAFDVAQVLRR